jgi:hypothetical protein
LSGYLGQLGFGLMEWEVRVEQGRLQLFGVVGPQPPGLRMVLAQNIPPIVLASAARMGNVALIAKNASITAPASIFKHRLRRIKKCV